MKAFFFSPYKKIILSFVAGYFLCFFVLGDNREFSHSNYKAELSEMENILRPEIAKVAEKHQVSLKLVRKKNELVVRVWDEKIFPINSSELSEEGLVLFKDIASVLKKIKSEVSFEISGHYDSIDPVGEGEKEVNKVLITTNRATQVANSFVSNGISAESLSIKGYGDKAPLFKDRDQYGQYIAQSGELNRRLEVKVKIGSVL